MFRRLHGVADYTPRSSQKKNYFVTHKRKKIWYNVGSSITNSIISPMKKDKREKAPLSHNRCYSPIGFARSIFPFVPSSLDKNYIKFLRVWGVFSRPQRVFVFYSANRCECLKWIRANSPLVDLSTREIISKPFAVIRFDPFLP